MAKPAYVILNSAGVVVRTHYVSGITAGSPTASAKDLEDIIVDGYVPVREIALDGGGALIVLQK